MAKNIKLTIKNTQIAQAINLDAIKGKLAKKKAVSKEEKELPSSKVKEAKDEEVVLQKEEVPKEETPKEEIPRIRARSKSAFAEPAADSETAQKKEKTTLHKRMKDEEQEAVSVVPDETVPIVQEQENKQTTPVEISSKESEKPELPEEPSIQLSKPAQDVKEKLGPTGRHIRDLLPKKYPPKEEPELVKKQTPSAETATKDKLKDKREETTQATTEAQGEKKGKWSKFKEFKDLKPTKLKPSPRAFEARDRHGFGEVDESFVKHRKRRAAKQQIRYEDTTIRPTYLKIRIPVTIKDLASEMKLKASELITKLFMQGLVVTINTLLDDPTTIELLGHEFGCQIAIDTSEEERIRITDRSIQEEIKESDDSFLMTRPPIVAFMGHVDHGKTSLIDAIRQSNRVAGEAGAITQHIGAFRCSTAVGDLTILDTPGHEAFSAMRERGANVTDIVVLVIAGDEGLRQQSIEAIQHARAANVSIVVALNKCDKPNFNAENVYRQLAEQELLPEAWGGQTITVNCSAKTSEGIPTLLEMLALQAEVLEIKANPSQRARGTVLESEMHKGLGALSTVLVQNGTLKLGDALVCDQYFGRVKSMQNEYGKEVQTAGPSTPVAIAGLSGLPDAGLEFIVVKNEREAKEIAEARVQGMRAKNLQQLKKASLESMFQKAAEETGKKIFNLIIRADVQGSLEALRIALGKIESKKIDLNIVFAGVGEISENDIQLAAMSKATILGFHTAIESHAEAIIKQLGIQVRMHDIIYHAIDDVKALMTASLEKIVEEKEMGKVEVKALFKSSQHGIIAGCIVTEGSVHRNHLVRLKRGKEIIWKGQISSLKRGKEDVREVQKGIECGIVLNNYHLVQEGDIIETYEIEYISQEL